MFDTFRHGSWSDKITTFWTFGQGTGTYILTVLGIVLMVGSLAAWVWLENRKLNEQVERLSGSGAFGGPTPAGEGS
jgi:hypothetical protein